MTKRNMSVKKVAMPELEADVRNKNFEEVAQGYSKEMALEEATRCLDCKNRPCVAGCPVNVQIPDFIRLAAEGKFIDAYEKIKETNSLSRRLRQSMPAGDAVRRALCARH